MPNLTEVARSKNLLLKVEGHSVTTAMGAGEFIKSSRWIVGGHFWEIHLRPKDHWAGRHRPVTLKLVLLSEPRGGRRQGQAHLPPGRPGRQDVPVRGEERGTQVPPPGGLLRPGPAVLTSREDLEASGYLADDAYAVQCAIAVLREVPPQTATVADDPRPEAALPSPDLLRHLRELLREGTGADVTFVVSGQPFAAHRAVLASRSPVFMAELFGGMREGSSRCVEVEDTEPAAFGALLGFVYTDTVPELDRLGEEEAASMAQHLLAGADRYGLERLKLICEWKLSDGITVDTAATTLALAEQHGCRGLKEACFRFLRLPGNLKTIMGSDEFQYLTSSCPSLLNELLANVAP